MKNAEKAIELIFNSSISFDERCAEIYHFQVKNSPVFRRFVEPFGLSTTNYPNPKDIPLLPIRAFKDGKMLVHTSANEPDLIFKSSGTSEMAKSTHYILSKKMYERAIFEEFSNHFPFDEYITLFYLPGYDLNPQSSLVWMANHLIESDSSGQSRYISIEDLSNIQSNFKNKRKKILLFGAAFGLMDILETEKFNSDEGMEILETGGMKTYRREMTKTELKKNLSDGFQVPMEKIHSEYGMCELLSQMYAVGSEWFRSPHWVQVSIRDPKNPSRICDVGEDGKIGIIDLANIYSCPFILTDDRGMMDESGRFKVLGRWNPEDLRGCNFLIDHE